MADRVPASIEIGGEISAPVFAELLHIIAFEGLSPEWGGEPFDAESRGIKDGDLVALASRSGDISLRAEVSERMQPGVVYTTFHHAATGANVITTDYSDWATNCPEYKVTAVEVRRTNYFSEWQERNREHDVSLRLIAGRLPDAAE